MAVNDTIRIADYNSIRNTVSPILGTGSATSGYGQTVRSSTVAEGNKVSINEWSNLRYDILNTWLHQTGGYPTTFVKVEGDTIRFNATTQPVDYYTTLASSLVSNKFNVAAGQFAISSATSRSYTSSWTVRLQTTIRCNWASSAAARHFFNGGGQILISASRTGGTTVQQNTSWSSLLSSSGTQGFGGNNPATGTTPVSGTNWFRTDPTYRTFYTASASSPYGANSYTLSARSNAPGNNSSGSASNVEFFVDLQDGYVDPGDYFLDSPNTSEVVDGTLTVSVSFKYPTGTTMLPSGSWIEYQPTSVTIDNWST